LLQEEVFLSP